MSTIEQLRAFTDTLPPLGGSYEMNAYPWGPRKYKVQATGIDAAFTIDETDEGFTVEWRAWLPDGGNFGAGTKVATVVDVCAWIAKTVKLDDFLFE